MKPMLLTAAESIPTSKDWNYEVKYDGFRCLILWDENGVKLMSRSNQNLTPLFPEISHYCHQLKEKIEKDLPLIFDGELVFLENNYKSNFSIVQKRGKMRAQKRIQETSEQFPCNIIIFDLLKLKDKDMTKNPFQERRSKLLQFFEENQLSLTPNFQEKGTFQPIETFESYEPLWDKIQLAHGEGIIAKKKSSVWESGKRTVHWIKVKNWRIVTVILTTFNKENGYFHGAVYFEDQLSEVTIFRHGFSDEAFKTLADFFQQKGQKIAPSIWTLPPSICVDVACIDFDGKKLREPRFEAFRFDIDFKTVSWKSMLRQLHPVPQNIDITHPDKPVWPEQKLIKDDYLYYLQKVAPFMLPFLQNRVLTTIRYPHGVPGEHFYQKNAPEYTPPFIATKLEETIDYIVCNDLRSLLWLGNQLAIEFHIPFNTIDTSYPTEIVFDLDPPSVDDFPLAIEAALQLKTILDHFQLHSFIKTSGGKGLQVYIPLQKNSVSYDETRVFTEFICRFLVEQNPKIFTMERMKKNRGRKLYLDYVQHAAGKTIVCPYSPRGNLEGLIATPLDWQEVNSSLTPKTFTIPFLLERMHSIGDPFQHFFNIGDKQPIKEVIATIQNRK